MGRHLSGGHCRSTGGDNSGLYEGGDSGSGKGGQIPEDWKGKLSTSVDGLGESQEVRVKGEHFSWRYWKDGVAVPEIGSLGGASFRDSSGV